MPAGRQLRRSFRLKSLKFFHTVPQVAASRPVAGTAIRRQPLSGSAHRCRANACTRWVFAVFRYHASQRRKPGGGAEITLLIFTAAPEAAFKFGLHRHNYATWIVSKLLPPVRHRRDASSSKRRVIAESGSASGAMAVK